MIKETSFGQIRLDWDQEEQQRYNRVWEDLNKIAAQHHLTPADIKKLSKKRLQRKKEEMENVIARLNDAKNEIIAVDQNGLKVPANPDIPKYILRPDLEKRIEERIEQIRSDLEE